MNPELTLENIQHKVKTAAFDSEMAERLALYFFPNAGTTYLPSVLSRVGIAIVVASINTHIDITSLGKETDDVEKLDQIGQQVINGEIVFDTKKALEENPCLYFIVREIQKNKPLDQQITAGRAIALMFDKAIKIFDEGELTSYQKQFLESLKNLKTETVNAFLDGKDERFSIYNAMMIAEKARAFSEQVVSEALTADNIKLFDAKTRHFRRLNKGFEVAATAFVASLASALVGTFLGASVGAFVSVSALGPVVPVAMLIGMGIGLFAGLVLALRMALKEDPNTKIYGDSTFFRLFNKNSPQAKMIAAAERMIEPEEAPKLSVGRLGMLGMGAL